MLMFPALFHLPSPPSAFSQRVISHHREYLDSMGGRGSSAATSAKRASASKIIPSKRQSSSVESHLLFLAEINKPFIIRSLLTEMTSVCVGVFFYMGVEKKKRLFPGLLKTDATPEMLLIS